MWTSSSHSHSAPAPVKREAARTACVRRWLASPSALFAASATRRGRVHGAACLCGVSREVRRTPRRAAFLCIADEHVVRVQPSLDSNAYGALWCVCERVSPPRRTLLHPVASEQA